MQQRYDIHAFWDEESKTWYTNGEDFPGLCVEAATFEELVQLVLDLIPELIAAGAPVAPGTSIDIPVSVTAERHGIARLVA
jgi:predicted RNase H-like HicB family nuclease